MEQVDKDINVRSKDEPQTCSVNGRPYSECSSCEHFKCTADEPQTIAEDINRRVEMGKKEWNARHIEDEPQTDCPWK